MGSSKNVLTTYNLTRNSGGTVTVGSSWTSGSVAVPFLDNVAIHLIWTAAALTSGTFAVNASCDGTSYSPLSMSGTPSVAGSADSVMISLNQVPFRFITISYASGTTGTGSINAFVTAKEIG